VPHARHDLLEQFQPFSAHAVFEQHEAGDIAAGPRQVVDEARADRIGDVGEHDRDGAGNPLKCRHALRATGQDDIRRERDQFRRIFAFQLDIIRPPADVNLHVAAVAPA
jgi:hypothetical protein